MENKLTLNKAQNATRLQFATERSGSQISDLPQRKQLKANRAYTEKDLTDTLSLLGKTVKF